MFYDGYCTELSLNFLTINAQHYTIYSLFNRSHKTWPNLQLPLGKIARLCWIEVFRSKTNKLQHPHDFIKQISVQCFAFTESLLAFIFNGQFNG